VQQVGLLFWHVSLLPGFPKGAQPLDRS